jgi:hypothetical protein
VIGLIIVAGLWLSPTIEQPSSGTTGGCPINIL